MEKIEKINAVIGECGLTAEEVVANLYESGAVSSDFLKSLCGAGEGKKSFAGINFVPSKKFVTPKTVEPGMFYYADGLIFPELIKDNQVSAIVGCVEKNHGLAMGLRETELPWSSNWLYIGMFSGLSGKEATEAILKAAKAQGKRAETAEWCASYAFDGIKAGTMFEPSKEELKRMFVNYRKLREPFSALELKGLQEDRFYWPSSEYGFVNSRKLRDPFSALELKGLQEGRFYWSSSECGCYYSWVVRPSDGGLNDDANKGGSAPVRCVLEFKI